MSKEFEAFLNRNNDMLNKMTVADRKILRGLKENKSSCELCNVGWISGIDFKDFEEFRNVLFENIESINEFGRCSDCVEQWGNTYP